MSQPANAQRDWAEDVIGQTLGQYQVVSILGRGGMAVVFKAQQANLNRPIGLKVLHPAYQFDPDFLRRFHHETNLAGVLTHPNIVRVHDAGQAEGYSFMAMEYVDGSPLNDIMQAGTPLDLNIVSGIVQQVGAALAFAHQRNIVHRDVKPSNILLERSGRALLSDFGIALAVGQTRLTQTGARIGTLEYMSPEQAEGGALDHRSDIYSFGIVLYQMVTGHLPFVGDTRAIITGHLMRPPPPPRRLNPKLSSAVERTVLRAIQKDPRKRYQSMDALVAALEAAVGRKVGVGGAGGRRIPVWVPAGVLGALLVIVITLFVASFSRPPELTNSPTSQPFVIQPTGNAPGVATTPAVPSLAPTVLPPTTTSTPTSTPTRTASEKSAALLVEVDRVWGRDWPQVIGLLSQAYQTDASNLEIRDKLYVAYYNYGQALLSQGALNEAVQQFQKALGMKPDGIEARQALLALTPTSTPKPVSTPTVGPVRNLLANPSFEQGTGSLPIGWNLDTFQYAKLTWESNISNTGQRSVSVGGPPCTPGGQNFRVRWMSNPLDVDPNTQYILTFWLRSAKDWIIADGAASISVRQGYLKSPGIIAETKIIYMGDRTPTTQWQRMQQTVRTPSDRQTVVIELGYAAEKCNGTPNTVYYDDIEFGPAQ
ncbi:MAG: protein kinase [Chloroflexi bacterium]|nr:protein kinase [Chloroflexota bacterium]